MSGPSDVSTSRSLTCPESSVEALRSGPSVHQPAEDAVHDLPADGAVVVAVHAAQPGVVRLAAADRVGGTLVVAAQDEGSVGVGVVDALQPLRRQRLLLIAGLRLVRELLAPEPREVVLLERRVADRHVSGERVVEDDREQERRCDDHRQRSHEDDPADPRQLRAVLQHEQQEHADDDEHAQHRRQVGGRDVEPLAPHGADLRQVVESLAVGLGLRGALRLDRVVLGVHALQRGGRLRAGLAVLHRLPLVVGDGLHVRVHGGVQPVPVLLR